jgi:urease accessory protein
LRAGLTTRDDPALFSFLVMVRIDQIPAPPERATLLGKERDTLVMTAEERQWTRRRVTTTAEREVALALATGVKLAPGMIIAIEADWYLEVEAAEEPLLAIQPSDRDSAVRIAFEVGNRHSPLALDGDHLLVPDDLAMEQLLNRLGVSWTRRRAPFNPVGRPHSHEL